VTARLDEWQEESRGLASLRDVSVIQFVRARGPVEAKAKRLEAEALQAKVNQLLAEAAHIDSIVLAAGPAVPIAHTNGARRPDMAESVAA
jgi:hypothetical protein